MREPIDYFYVGVFLMKETSIYHLVVEHRLIVFAVCAVFLTFMILIIGIKLMKHLDHRRGGENPKKKE